MVVVVLYLGVRLRMQQVDIEDITVSHHPRGFISGVEVRGCLPSRLQTISPYLLYGLTPVDLYMYLHPHLNFDTMQFVCSYMYMLAK